MKILATPHYECWEIIPGIEVGKWIALAQVNESLAVIELKVTKL